MQSAFSQETAPRPRTLSQNVWGGIGVGAIPLALLLGFFALGLALTAAARALTIGSGFFTEQVVTVIVLAAGLLLAATVYTIAIVRVWRHMKGLWQAGNVVEAYSILWTLALTAVLVLVPLLLAFIIPQHPAPPK